VPTDAGAAQVPNFVVPAPSIVISTVPVLARPDSARISAERPIIRIVVASTVYRRAIVVLTVSRIGITDPFCDA
jgi:hypothetical protein